jgi:ubiquinol-cytochrome c reductase cytochrome b subunit
MGKGLYSGSYRAPRRALWIVGVLIFICKKATAFIGKKNYFLAVNG